MASVIARGLDRKSIVRVEDLNVKCVSVVKYLGVHMGEGMLLLPHLCELRQKNGKCCVYAQKGN